MHPVKVFTKAIVVLESERDPAVGLVAEYVDGKIHASYPHRPIKEAHRLAERLAHSEAELELARLTCRRRVVPVAPEVVVSAGNRT